MRRLNNTELETRINSFLGRKFAEFPELAEPDIEVEARRTQNRTSRRPRIRNFHPRIRWGTAL